MSVATASGHAVETPAYEGLIARGHALVSDFADRAAKCESDCRVSDEAVARFVKRACTRLCCRRPTADTKWVSRPARTSFAIGKVCASSAWVCGLYMAHSWLGGLFPKQAQDEMWARRSGCLHLRLLRTNRQGNLGQGRLSAVGAISVFQRLARRRMESLRRDVSDRARGQAGASLHPGAKG